MKRFLIYLLLALSVFTAKGQFVINSYAFGGSSYAYLLDSTATSTVAHSLRVLKVGYTGPLIKVRAGTTNAEATVMPDATKVVSPSSIVTITAAGTSGFSVSSTMTFSAFYGSQSVYVPIVYDQQGSNNAVQATAGNQPRIVDAGTMETQNGKPVLRFISANNTYLSFSNVGSASAYTMTFVGKAISAAPASAHGPLLGDLGVDTNSDHWPWTDGNMYDGAFRSGRFSIGSVSSPTLATYSVGSIQSNATNYIFRWAKSQKYLSASGTVSRFIGDHRIGGSTKGAGFYFDGYWSESIVWNSALTTDLTLAENNAHIFWVY